MTGLTMRRLSTALSAALFLAVLPSVSRAQNRVAHTATLLATGDILIAGGVDSGGNILNTADVITTSIGPGAIPTGTMTVRRASHTATMMNNGCVFVAGGNSALTEGAAVAPELTTRIYNPGTNAWTAGTVMGTARYNHTATLLNDGRVLICGGSDGAGAALASCEFYTPTSCTGGTMAPAPNLLQARFNHTAVLLKDGRVWFAGGVNPLIVATGGYLVTTERYDSGVPLGFGAFQSASPMIEARSQHTATLMGDGKALVVGGFNRRDVIANTGITESAEIYDPISNSVTPAAQMTARRHAHTAVLRADGSVQVFGGLGNITTTYVDPSVVVDPASSIVFGAPIIVPTATVINAGSNVRIPLDFRLNKEVVGTIANGEMWLSSPSIKAPWGSIDFTPSAESPGGAGIRVNLAGFVVGCTAGTGAPPCGRISTGLTPVNLTNVSGNVIFYRRLGVTPQNLPVVAGGGNVNFTSLIDSANLNTALGAGTQFTTTIKIDMGMAFANKTLTNGTLTITGGSLIQPSSFTAVLTGGTGNIPSTAIAADGTVIITVPFTGVTGGALFTGQAGQAFAAGNHGIPMGGANTDVSLAMSMVYVTNGADLTGERFKVDIATVIIRKMVMADHETYNPKTNQWNLNRFGGTVQSDERYGHSATLLRNNDTVFYGGRDCSGALCASRIATGFPLMPVVSTEKNFVLTSGSAAGKRAFHTTTLLPTGDLVIAGGTNGPSILRTAELFNPNTETFSPVAGPMRYVRDLHTATLLPNGRVLIAGGFTTNAASTGSTNTSEIYYPDTKLFLETMPMISSRSNHTAILLPDGNVFVAGGFGPADVITGTSEIYISTQGRWVPAATMPSVPGPLDCRRAIHASVQLKNGRILLIGGVNIGGPMTTSALYDPATNTWDCTTTAAIGAPGIPGGMPLRSHSATLLFDGRVLVSGGNDGLGEANASYIYDPASNTWDITDTVPLTQPRFNHTATLLPNGNVTISGGSTRFGAIPTTVESYHVNASSWSGGTLPTTFIGGSRAFHTMTLGLNNKLFAIGGSDGVIGGAGVSLYSTAESGYFTASPDAVSKDAPPSFRQSTVTLAYNSALPARPLTAGGYLTVSGNLFRGGTEASGGGAASGNSAFSFPHLILQQLDGSGGAASQSNGGFVVDLTTQIYIYNGNFDTLNTSVTVALPLTTAGLPNGWYAVRVGANDLYSNGKLIQAGPPKPTVPPGVITGVALGTSAVQWSWPALVTVPPIDGYNVYNATTGVFLTTIPAIGAPTYFQTNLDPSATTSILIAGYSQSGDGPLTASPTSYTLSTMPVNVTIASVTFSDLLLYWGTNGNSFPGTVYEVTQSSDDFVTNVSTPIPQIFNHSDPFTTITNLTANTTYFFRVRAFNLNGVPSPYSISVSTRTRAPVSQPVVTSRNTSSIDWGWGDPGGVTNYRVYNATSGALIAVPITNSFTEIGLATNTQHSIYVSAVTNAGEGPLSPSATAYTAAASPGLFAPQATPTTGSLLLNWSNNGNPLLTGYEATLTEHLPDGFTLPPTTSYITPGFSMGFGGLKPSTLYSYTLVAYNGDNLPSDVPPVVTGSTWTLPTAPDMSPPFGTAGTTPTSISVVWGTNNNSSSATYQVTYSTDNFVFDISTAIAFAANFKGTNATIPNLVTGATYSVRVIASNPFGALSQFSVSATTRTFNGGCTVGSLCGPLLATQDSVLFGTIGAPLRNVVLRAPAQSFPSDVTVTISTWSLADHPGGPNCSAGAANYSFEIVNTPALQPAKGLYLSFSFQPADLGTITAKRALLMRYDPASNTCVPLETVVNTGTGEMLARINHFSIFQLAQVPLTNTAETARIFPNPYYTGRDGYVTIDNVPPGARVRIFTLRGEQVLDVQANTTGVLTWSGTNGSGRSVASGMYLVMVEFGATKKILKLAVIR